ncbi:mitotic checkpoint regulator, MAD2B-interacting-domain-containing protein [Cladochytrium replicatum]|nr:mitotic checkpoint regulator, MAD2B-interacting-domain-containing protein [Cladochytrium replicatum]
MDFLASYASESDDEDVEPPPPKRHAHLRQSVAQPQSSASATVSSLLASLPKPVAGGKKVFRVELPTAGEDEDGGDGKIKADVENGSVKKKLSWLPAPKNAGPASAGVSRESLLMLPSAKAKANQPDSSDTVSKSASKDMPSSSNEDAGDSEESFFTIVPQQTSKPYDHSLSSSSSTFTKPALPPSSNSSSTAAHPSSMYSYVGPSMPSTESYENAYPEADDLEEPTQTIPSDVDFAMIEKLGGAKAFRKGAAELEIQDISFEEQLSDQWQYEGLRHKKGLGMTGAVRPGKMDRKRHSLMSLVHEAQSRRDELEDAYAQRRMNRKTNSMKYGS